MVLGLPMPSTKQQEVLLRSLILSLICVVAFSTRLFSVLRYESIIHEFDPWFNFRATKYVGRQGAPGYTTSYGRLLPSVSRPQAVSPCCELRFLTCPPGVELCDCLVYVRATDVRLLCAVVIALMALFSHAQGVGGAGLVRILELV